MELNNLRSVSFSGVIQLKDLSIVRDYRYKTFKDKGRRHEIDGYCTHCEKTGVNFVNGKPLSLMMYGAHTQDFLDYLDDPAITTENWHQAGVLFLFENPAKPMKKFGGLDSAEGMYKICPHMLYAKSPMLNAWPYIGWGDKTKKADFDFPNCFGQRHYGALILSMILLFQLENAYVTNVVKCGTNDGDNLEQYNEKTINTCIHQHLLREIKALNPAIIFAFGRRAYSSAKAVEKYRRVVYLPHPASRVSNHQLKEAYSVGVLKALCEAQVIEPEGNLFKNLKRLFEVTR